MTAAATVNAFGRLTAAMIRGISPISARKAVDDPGRTSTTLVNDDTLWIPLEADSEYEFILKVTATAAAIGNGDIKIALTWPAGSTAEWDGYGFATSGTTASVTHVETGSGNAHAFGIDGTSTSPVTISGNIATGSSAGPLRVRWAPNSSTSTATVVKAGSKLTAWQTG